MTQPIRGREGGVKVERKRQTMTLVMVAVALVVGLLVSSLPAMAHYNVTLCGPVIDRMKPLADRVEHVKSEWRTVGERNLSCLEGAKGPIYAGRFAAAWSCRSPPGRCSG